MPPTIDPSHKSCIGDTGIHRLPLLVAYLSHGERMLDVFFVGILEGKDWTATDISVIPCSFLGASTLPASQKYSEKTRLG